MRLTARFLVPALLASFLAMPSLAELKVNPNFGSGMVLQSGMKVPVWGLAKAGDKIVVDFAGQQKSAVADDKGNWTVTLDPLDVSAVSRTLTVTAGEGGKPEKKEFTDVLVGEVWVGSGQSNMQMSNHSYTNQDPVLCTNVLGSYPLLRLAGAAGKGGWRPATNNNAGFSALLFSFGLKLHQELGVPVGLMAGAIGGTPSGYWLSEAAYAADAACKADVEKGAAVFDQIAYDKLVAAQMANWSQAVAKATEAKITDPKVQIPGQPQPPLKPGQSRDAIGNLYEKNIRGFQPYAIRGVLWDQGESGTGIGSVMQTNLMNALVNGWRKEWGQNDFPFLCVQKPSGGGRAWDPADPVTCQAEKPAALPAQVPGNGHYREEHLNIGKLPNVFTVISSDLGSGVHPLCKSGYGARAARVALGAVYKKPVEYYGPTFKSFTVEGGKVRVQFDHVGKGLAIAPDAVASSNAPALQGFAVAGTNKVFKWAQGVIDGNAVILECAQVPEPVAVRYAWSDRIPWANLFNKDGLPSQAFRTDSW
jgi:sialate O-acetylesterase